MESSGDFVIVLNALLPGIYRQLVWLKTSGSRICFCRCFSYIQLLGISMWYGGNVFDIGVSRVYMQLYSSLHELSFICPKVPRRNRNTSHFRRFGRDI
jgi:hypothetical protein